MKKHKEIELSNGMSGHLCGSEKYEYNGRAGGQSCCTKNWKNVTCQRCRKMKEKK